MNITIIPQTLEQFDRLMAFLEKDHAAFVADLERKAEVESKRNEMLANAINNALEYFASLSGPKH